MHTVHHTESFILRVAPLGEANVRVWLFTRDFGLVIATVQGVRKQGAKLQMQLSQYSLISADLVRGKDTWRLVSVSEIENPLSGNLPRAYARTFARTIFAVERFCHGEEANHGLFDHIRDCLKCAINGEIDPLALDTVSVSKVMALLGYEGLDEKDKEILSGTMGQVATLLDKQTIKRLIVQVNTAIQQTHL